VLPRQALYHVSHTPALFALGIFQIGSPIYAQAGLDRDSPTSASCVAGVTGTCHHAQVSLIAHAALEPQSSQSLGLQIGVITPARTNILDCGPTVAVTESQMGQVRIQGYL
jgi:hypothetical protein